MEIQCFGQRLMGKDVVCTAKLLEKANNFLFCSCRHILQCSLQTWKSGVCGGTWGLSLCRAGWDMFCWMDCFLFLSMHSRWGHPCRYGCRRIRSRSSKQSIPTP